MGQGRCQTTRRRGLANPNPNPNSDPNPNQVPSDEEARGLEIFHRGLQANREGQTSRACALMEEAAALRPRLNVLLTLTPTLTTHPHHSPLTTQHSPLNLHPQPHPSPNSKPTPHPSPNQVLLSLANMQLKQGQPAAALLAYQATLRSLNPNP